MPAAKSLAFRFADITVREREFSIIKAGQVFSVEPRAFRVLLVLLRNPRKLITKEELLSEVWAEAAVTENSLTRAITLLRRMLGDDAREPRFIETVTTLGYRWLCAVEVCDEALERMEPGGRTSPNGIEPQAAGNVPAQRPGAAIEPTNSGKRADGGRNASRTRTLIGAVSLLLVLTSAGWFLRPALGPPQVTDTTQLTQDGVPKSYGLKFNMPLVTDGSRVYFVEDPAQLFRHPVMQVSTQGGDTIPVGIRDGFDAFLEGISPDGNELVGWPGFKVGQGGEGSIELLRFSLPDMKPKPIDIPLIKIESNRLGGPAAAWSPDGRILYYGSGSDIFAADADGKNSRKLLTVPGQPFWVRVSPDGHLLRFSVTEKSSVESLWEVRSDGSGLKQLFSGLNAGGDVCCGNWTTDGKYFVFQSVHAQAATLWVMRDAGDLWRKVSHEPVELTHDEMIARAPVPSRDGKRIFFIGIRRRGEVVRYDLRTQTLTPFLPGLSAEHIGFSKDGRRMAYISYPQGILWQSKVDGSDRHQLTFALMKATTPRWSPDGSTIAFSSGVSGQVFVVPAEGGKPEQLTFGNQPSLDASWSPDGNSLVYSGPWSMDSSRFPLHVVNVRTREVTEVPHSGGMFGARWSQDGRYLLTEVLGQDELTLYDFKLRSWQPLATLPGLGYWNWGPDGRCVYVTSDIKKDSQEYRICLRDHKIEHVADMAGTGKLVQGIAGVWTGLGPDGSILALRDIGTEEIYSLEIKFP